MSATESERARSAFWKKSDHLSPAIFNQTFACLSSSLRRATAAAEFRHAPFPTAPFRVKVGGDSPAGQAKWQRCTICLSISVQSANLALHTESNLDFLPSGDFLCDVLKRLAMYPFQAPEVKPLE